MKNFVSEPWKRDGYSCLEEYQWNLHKSIVFYWLSDITNPSFPKAVCILEWALNSNSLDDTQKEKFLSRLDEIRSQFNSEDEAEDYLQKIHG